MSPIKRPSEEVLAQLFPRCRIEEHIADGGFKAVYRAKVGNAYEALKIVQLPKQAEDELSQTFYAECLGRIKRELAALAKCTVPQLVRLGSIVATPFEDAGESYIGYSEEFLEGSDLGKLLNDTARTSPSEVELQLLMRSLVLAIQELWSYGYIHRDIKPLNIIKTKNPERPFVLLDLGIAFSVRETALTYNPIGRMPPATYRYMAPEMGNPSFRETIDYRSDLYSAALSVYEYGAGKHPLSSDADDLFQTVSRAIREPAKPLKTYRPDLSEGFCQMIDQLLKKKPALRPANINRLLASLEGSI